MSDFTLYDLERIVAARADASPDESWTARLVTDGIEKAGKKFGEEAFETLIAALSQDDDAVISESADLLYHWLVMLHLRKVPLDAVLAELERRTTKSGLAEKAARKQDRE